MPFQVTNPESIDLMKKMVKLQMETTADTQVICDALLQMLGMCIVAMSHYNPHVARELYNTIGDNLTDIIVEELRNKPAFDTLTEEQQKQLLNISKIEVDNKWKM